MKNTLRALWISFLALGAGLSFSACDAGYYSTGYPEVNYKLPNIVLGRAEAWSRDLIATPKVFSHTTGDYLYYDARSSDTVVADAYVRNGFLYVTAGRPGAARIQVRAQDSDGEYAIVEFQVTVEANKAKE